MTDRPADRPDTEAGRRPVPGGHSRPGAAPAVRKKPGFMPTVLLGIASFVALFVFLAFQLNSGNDPALGKSALAAGDAKATDPARPLVIHRRIVKTRVVHLPAESPAAGSALPAGTAPPRTSPTTTAPPPVTASS
ncbi:MAG: hypothetical protein R2691_12665 [Solirubrobacterales bacterium]